ncbi:MAG: PHP domain-containing protein, partial [Angustibacter sp.]
HLRAAKARLSLVPDCSTHSLPHPTPTLELMRIDLHTHSATSDGTQSPAQVIASAADAGLSVVALTDHDTTDGWVEAQAAATQHGLSFIPGMEVSTKLDTLGVHILSYLHDPACQELQETISLARKSRVTRARKFVEALSRDFDISWELVCQQVAPGATIGRPHIADALVAQGIVRDRNQAFAEMLHRDSQYYVPYEVVSPIQAISQIRRAGGVAIVAHPLARARGHCLDEATLHEFIAAGLSGIEVDHRDHSPQDRAWLRSFAERNDLIATGSSDYHGAGKPNALGENLTHEDDFAELLRRAQPVPS